MNVVCAVGFAFAATLLLALSVLLATGWRGKSGGLRPIAAVLVSALWAALNAWQCWSQSVPQLLGCALELLRDGAWILVLTSVAHGVLPTWLTRGAHAVWLGLLAATFALALGQSLGHVDTSIAVLQVPGGLAISLVMLVLLEQIFRNANAAGRQSFRFLAIGLGGVFAYDLFLYSQAQLMRGISEELWAARGWINALQVPLLAIAARRTPDWSLDVFVSRQVAVFTTAVTAVGIYLLLMALGGYYLQQAGGSWGVALNAIFFVGALMVLAMVVFSGAVRRRLRVFIAKHFYRNKFDYRVEWLRFVQTMTADGAADIRVQGLQAMAQVHECPGAVMYLRPPREQHYWPAAAWPMAVGELPRLQPVVYDHDLAQFMTRTQWVIDLAEHRQAPDFYQNMTMPAWLSEASTYRLIVPLLRHSDLVGFVLMMEPPPPFDPTYEDRDLLKILGNHVATIVAQHEADRQLAESRQFEAFHRLTAFMMHDLKNAAAQLRLIVSNAERHRHNPEFIDDAIGTVANTAERITGLIEQLRAGTEGVRASRCELVPSVRAAIERCASRQPAPTLTVAIPEHVLVACDADGLTSAIEHVIRNAQDASGAADAIDVSLTDHGTQVAVTVTDAGAGMNATFIRERLFRPFDSTKGSKGMGIGAYQVREFVRSIGGRVEVQSSPGSGTRFQLMLPVAGAGGA